jgi:signal peptidase I
VQAFKIPTGSMEENLLVGDHLLVNKFVFGPATAPLERALLPVAAVDRGDVVVFKYPEEPERDFIKRVIGLPGETLEVRDKRVYIDGAALEEPYAHYLEPMPSGTGLHESTPYDVRDRYGPVTVPAGHFFVMGDNRDNSQDSRYWGFLPREYIKGRALVIYWSYDAAVRDPRAAGGSALGNAISVVTSFFTRTRWARMLRQIE